MTGVQAYLQFAAEHPRLFANPPGDIFTVLLDTKEIEQVENEMEERLKQRGIPESKAKEWSRVGIVFEDPYLLVLRDAVRFPGGSTGTYFRMVHRGETVPGVIILPVFEGQLVLVRHFRHATRMWHLEVPRGFGSPELTPEENARRELFEEIQGEIGRFEPLGTAFLDTGATANVNAFFYVELAKYGKLDHSEAIAELILVPITDLNSMIARGEMTDGFTLTALALAHAKGLM